MKNLKKVLSLVLALAMALSLMTVAFAADANDFADYDKVEHNEAVDVMVATGVFNGVEGNKFAPQDTLTREMAAKIITYMIMGQKEADKLTTTVAPYADVAASRWSAGAIAWCTEQGILAGSNGKFNPTGKLTGLAFAKMCLTALGYDAEIEKLVGSSWAINAATLAIQNDLDDGMEKVSLSSNLTREQAAQMALNTMKADMVAYANKGTNITLSDGTNVVIGATPAAAIVSNIKTIADNGYLQFAEKYFEKLVMKTEDKGDDFMRPATEWKYDGDKVGAYINDDAVAVYTEGFDADELKDLKDDYTFNNTKIWVNGVDQTTEIGGVDNLAAREYKGTVVELYDVDEDDNIETIVVVQAYVAQVTDKDEDIITLDIYNPWESKNASSVDFKDDTKKTDDTYDKLAAKYDEDDYLIVYTKGAVANEDILDFADAEVVTGKVATVKVDDPDEGYNGYFTIDGTKYNLASGYNAVEIKAASEYNFYLDENGYVIGAELVKESSAAIDEIYYVDNIWSEKSTVAGNKDVETYYAQIASLNGAVKEIELESIEKESKDQNAAYQTGNNDQTYTGKLVTISDKKWTDKTQNKDTHKAGDDKFDLKVWNPNTEDTWDLYTASAFKADFEKTSTRIGATVTGAASGDKTFRLNASTQYLFLEGNTNKLAATTYTGGVAFAANKVNGAFVITENDSLVAKYIVIRTDNADQAQTFSDDAVYLAEASTEKGDGYRIQEVYKADGKKTTLNVAEGEYDLTAGFYTYDTNSDGYYVLESANSMTISKNFVWEDEEGAITGATIAKDALFADLLTVTKGNYTVEDIDVASAKFVNVSDKDVDGNYDKDVTTLARLCELVDNEKVGTVTLALNVSKDGAVIIVVTDIDAKA